MTEECHFKWLSDSICVQHWRLKCILNHTSYLPSDWPTSSIIDQSDDSFQNGVWNIRGQEDIWKINGKYMIRG